MKKYHIADVLTFSRFILGGLLIFFTIAGVSPTLALIVFVLAELTDAFDGMAARHWPYPNDGKKRWWRECASGIDQIADIFLGLTLLIYIMVRMDAWVAYIAFALIIVIAIPVQIWRHFQIEKYGPKDELVRKVVLARRYLYVAGLYALFFYFVWHPATFTTIAALPFSNLWLRCALTIVSVVCIVVLVLLKRDRLSEDKTPLPSRGHKTAKHAAAPTRRYTKRMTRAERKRFGQQTRLKQPKPGPRYTLTDYPFKNREK